MHEAGREAIGNEPILAIVSEAKKIQYLTREKLRRLLSDHGNNDFHIGTATPSMTDETYMEKVSAVQQHVRDGNICQAVLARHFTAPVK